MPADPYTPPSANLSDPLRSAMAAWKAVLLGLAIDVGGSFSVALVAGSIYAAIHIQPGMSPAEISAEMAKMSEPSWLAAIATLAGAALSFLGGMVCTRVARRTDYSLGFLLASITSVTGLLLSFEQYSANANVLLTSLTFGAVMLGARFGRASVARSVAA